MGSFHGLLVLLMTIMVCNCCTDFRFPAEDLKFSARTMDFMTLQFTQVRFIQTGGIYNSGDVYSGVSWITQMGYLSFTSYGVNNTVDGLNQCGLSCALLTLMETKYQNVTNSSSALGMSDICDFILGQYCTIEDVKSGISKVTVYRDYLTEKISCPLLHVSVHDENGDSLVIEFIEGEQVFHDNKIGILTNDPTYDWHIKNIMNYNYINNVAPTGNIQINDFNFSAAYYGYPISNFGISSDDSPVSRFVRISQLIRYMTVPKNYEEAILMGYHLLEKVSVVPGFSKIFYDNKYLTDVTIYRIIRDHTYRRIYFATYNDLVLKMIDISIDIPNTTSNHVFIDNKQPCNYLNITATLL